MKQIIPIVALIWFNTARAEITAAELLAKCDENNLVVERVEGTAKVVGEEMNSYCRGYVEGHLAALSDKVCLKGRDTHFVVSVLKRYLSETPAAAKQPAGEALSKALVRAYACKSP